VLDRYLVPFTLCRLPHLPLRLIIIDDATFVSLFSTTGESQLHLGIPPAEVEPERDKRDPAPRCPTDQAADLRAVQEQFSRPLRFVVCVPPLFVWRYVAVEQPHLAPLDPGITAGQVGPAPPETFYFGPLQDYSRLVGIEDFEVPPGPLVRSDRAFSHVVNDRQGQPIARQGILTEAR